jgi:putative flippase GtrA
MNDSTSQLLVGPVQSATKASETVSGRACPGAEPRCHYGRRPDDVGKRDTYVQLEFLALLLDRFTGSAPSIRFLMFAIIGGVGVITHLTVLRLAIGAFAVPFAAGQAVAATVAMTGNFLLNNAFTYRDRRLRGRAAMRGLLQFFAICGVGLAANVALATHLFAAHCQWWLAAIAGTAVGVVWNYALSSALVWRLGLPANMARQHATPPGPRRTQADQPPDFGRAAD